MVRRKTQKAGANAKLQNESYMNALKRNYVFFHSKLKGEEPSKEKRFIEPSEEEEVKRVLLNAKARGMETNDIIKTIFHSDPVKFQQELSNWEDYAPEGILNKGTPYERRAFPIAKSLNRFIGTIQSSPKHLQYKSDFMVHICENSNFTEPVTSLNKKFCFSVLTPEIKQTYEDNKGTGYAVSYIIVKPEFFPPRVTVSGGPINLNAQRIPSISFLLDAFQQDGVLEIEPTLKATLEREAPELLEFSKADPLVLITPEQLGDPSLLQGRFIVIDPDIMTIQKNVINMKNIPTKDVLQEALAQKKVYFMDAKTMYDLWTKYPALWNVNFGTTNNKIFHRLKSHEQLVFCFLLYKFFEESYSTLNEGNATETLKFVKKMIFEADYSKPNQPNTTILAYDLADLFTLENEENLRQLVKIQQDVFNSVKIRTYDEVKKMLSKFDPVEQELALKRNYPKNILNQRAPYLQAYQNALRAPVSNSKIPSFLKTRKARNANVDRWRTRVRTAKAALLAFNKEHNLPFSRGAERYNY